MGRGTKYKTVRATSQGKNAIADKLSRKFSHEAEWMLDPSIFSKITKTYFSSTIKLIALQKNAEFEK